MRVKKRDLRTVLAVSDLFSFKTVTDEMGNEFVLFKNNPLTHIVDISDKTAFEALENHRHIFDKIKPKNVAQCISVGEVLGETLLRVLKLSYPKKKFIVYISVSVGDSMIIRFHQKWENEMPYYEKEDVDCPKNERLLRFESE